MAEWVWDHTLGDSKRDEPAEPGPIVLDLPPTEEETSMRSSSVAYDGPAPPDPNDHRTPHATEHRDW